MAAKSKVSKLFTAGARRPDAPLDRAALAVDQFQFDQAKQIARMIDTVAGAFAGDLVVFPEHRRQL